MRLNHSAERTTEEAHPRGDRLATLAEEATRGGFSLFLGNASAIFINALAAVVVARLLGPANYGLFSLSLVIPSLAVAMADLGLSLALTRYSAKLSSEQKGPELAAMFRSVFVFKLVVAVLAVAAVLVFSDGLAAFGLRRPDMAEYLRLASVLIVLQSIFGTTSSTLIGLGRMRAAGLMMTTQSAARGIVMPALVLLGFSVTGAILGHVSGFIVGAIVGVTAVIIAFRGSPATRIRSPAPHRSESLKIAIRYGFPLFVMTVLSIFFAQYQNIVLAQSISDTEIGNFNAAVNISSAISIVAFPIATALFPAFSKINPELERGELKRMFVISKKCASLLLIPSSIFVALVAGDLVAIIYGVAFRRPRTISLSTSPSTCSLG